MTVVFVGFYRVTASEVCGFQTRDPAASSLICTKASQALTLQSGPGEIVPTPGQGEA